MNNIKIGSIVRCNDWGMVYSNLNGLVYDFRWVGGGQHPIAIVAFEYETKTREISTELLTSIGEIEPEYEALNYRPGSCVKLREDYIVDHIELHPKLRQFGQDTTFYKVSAIVTHDNHTLKNMCGITSDDVEKYCRNDSFITKQINKNLLNTFYGAYGINSIYGVYGINSKTLKEEIQMKTQSKSACNPIKKVIFNDPATIVFWKDGTKTIVKCQEGAEFDPEKGLAMAISRHYLCDICGLERYDGIFKRYMPKEEKK